jgi:hypothetical protein
LHVAKVSLQYTLLEAKYSEWIFPYDLDEPGIQAFIEEQSIQYGMVVYVCNPS